MSGTNKDDYEWADQAVRPRYWVTQDGRRLLPREMTTEHLRNILQMSIRNYQLTVLCGGVTMNSEHWLQVASSPEHMRLNCIDKRPVLRDIENELLTRGITK